MNDTSLLKMLISMLAVLLFSSLNAYAESEKRTRTTTTVEIKDALTIHSHYSFEMAKFRVLVSKEDLSKGRLILDCESIGCDDLEGLYNPDTIVYLPNNQLGTTRSLLNYSGREADISIRKSDGHVRRIRLYK